MSVWAEAKEALELNWRDQWNEIASSTTGEQPDEVHQLLSELSQAEKSNDRLAFVRLKAQLASLPSWSGSKPISSGNPAAGSEISTVAPIQLGFLT